jgi:hypothetical protein
MTNYSPGQLNRSIRKENNTKSFAFFALIAMKNVRRNNRHSLLCSVSATVFGVYPQTIALG